ncbi:MAG: hypothetical protein IT457_24000 [Planctomycetes bacterium]|nr:hypothetical protein [Planctomycetota bacterium]
MSRVPKSIAARVDRLSMAGEVEGAGPTPPEGEALVAFGERFIELLAEPLPPLPGERRDPELEAARRADVEAFRVALQNYARVLGETRSA